MPVIPYDVDTDPVIAALCAEAEADPDVIAVVLTGSRAFGVVTEESDYDAIFVVTDEALERYTKEDNAPIRGGTVDPPISTKDIWHDSLGAVGKDNALRLDLARVIYDRTGETTTALKALQTLPQDQVREVVAGAYDAYLNAMYRSLKSWHRDNELGGRLEAVHSIDPLLDMLFALEGHWRPFSSRIYRHLHKLDAQGWKLDELRDILIDLCSTGDPVRQQTLAWRIKALLEERGYGDVYDSWEGQIDRALAWTFT